MLNETQKILERLAAADRERQKEAGGRFLLRALKYCWAAVLAAFVLDAGFHLDAGWRLGLLLSLFAGLLGLAAIAWFFAFVQRQRLEQIARFLESREPSLGSQLINLLQLQAQIHDASLAPLTRDLARQAVEGYAGTLQRTPLERLARTSELRRDLKRALWAGLGFAAVLVVFPQVTAVEVARFADPYGDHPPYSFTRLEIVAPGATGTNVFYGKGIVVKAKAAGHQPKAVFLTWFPPGHPEQAVTIPMFDKGGAGYDQLVDNIRTELLLCAHTKDRLSVSKQVRIGVVLTPKLEKAFVTISPPAYTGLKPEEKPYAFKGLQALAGSKVQFRLQSNRPLRDGLIEVTSADQPAKRVPMSASAEKEVSGSFSAEDSARLRFSVVDVAGRPSQDDWEGALTVTHDLPPEVHITEPERDALVAMDFKLQVHIAASDDYGLRTVRIHRGLNGAYSAPRAVLYDTVVRDVHEVLDLNFAELGVQPDDVISLFAEAVDTAPEPHLARSQMVRLRVISVEQYNNYLREQTDVAEAEAKYGALMDDLQELIEAQKQLGEAAQKLRDQVAKATPKSRDDLTRQLDGLQAKQNELNEKLNRHAQRLDNFVRQNPLYDVELELQTLLQRQAERIRQSTQANDAVGRDIARRSLPPTGPRQLSPDMPAQLKQASDEQVARLGGVQEATEKEVAQTLRDMSLMQELQKDFNQFEALYQTQQELAAEAQAYNRAGQLSREDQLALKELAATQKQVGDLLQQLDQKLRGDAQAAKKLFPKAAKSGLDLAQAIAELRLQPLARQATGRMLAGDGERSFHLADRLRSEMEKLFSECQGGNCPACGELDAYLSLQRSMNPGRNFAQMARSRKFGSAGQQGRDMGLGLGERKLGTVGYAVMGDPAMQVLGNEQAASRSSATARQSSRFGKGAGALTGKAGPAEPDKADVVKGLNPVNRQSGAVASETVIEEYSDLVDNYFKAITTKKKP